MRRMLIAVSAFLLSGCWFGYGLFADSDARTVLTPGVYQLIEPGKPARQVRIAILPSGMTRLDDPDTDDGDAVYGFLPLPGRKDRLLAWITMFGKPAEQQTQIYFFGEKRGDRFALFVPMCSGEDGKIAVANGAAIETGSGPSCRFSNKVAVLRALALVRPDEDDTLVLRPMRRP